MTNLAAKTLVTAHETILARWRQEKPAQVRKLAEPVRTEPIYRPLSPSGTEERFYQERDEYLGELDRYRVRKVEEIRNGHVRSESRLAVIEDSDRMAVYRGRVPEILRGALEWPTDVIAFGREAVPKRVRRDRMEMDGDDTAPREEMSAPEIVDLLPKSILDSTARVSGVDEYLLYPAVDDLQSSLRGRLRELVAEYGVERCRADHLVIEDEDGLIENALAGYSDETREAVALVHQRSNPRAARYDGTPLQVACSPTDIYQITDVALEGGARASKST
ncbi:hypothetical protein [Halorubellus sp. PRR65]|uniref:hypothetical protein n=1 Tax=Halorubellus sp. PRR65 TaxID=3098148 RepID=UPI002B260D43|nr:hypothetical protein [Halorubellus sp. PRR65]